MDESFGNTCHCDDDTLKVIVRRSSQEEPKNDAKIINFGKVEVGKRKVMKFVVKNHYGEQNVFTIVRDPLTNPLYQVFNFNSYKVSAKPHKSFECRISYTPQLPNTYNIDNFQIVDSNGNALFICTEGESVGPRIDVSTGYLNFYVDYTKPTSKNSFELLNRSNIAAQFYFDVNDNDNVFRISHRSGTIKPNDYLFVMVTFAPRVEGKYCRQLECLVYNGEPVIIKLFGIYADPEDISSKQLMERIKVEPPSDPYHLYTKDVQLCLSEKPTISLTENYMNFGGVPLANPTLCSTKTMITSLTNHIEDTISVSWETGDIFSINPKSVDLPSGESVLLECTYCPEKPDTIYEKTINGCILWNFKESSSTPNAMTVPLNASLRCLGHSFAQNTYWFPQLDIVPETIVLPAAVPNGTAFVTFMLKTGGRLPVSFVFIPPNQTNFIVKPMIGVVEDYRLIVAQLQCQAMDKSKMFVEQWKIMLNDQPDHLIYFYIKGFVDLPSVVVGKNNRVDFPNVQSLCTEVVQVQIQNCSQHHLKYEFKTDANKYLKIQEQVGELRVNEVKLLDWSYTNDDNKSLNFQVDCILHVIEKKMQIVGEPFQKSVHVSVVCCSSEICCSQDRYDAGIVECMQTVSVSMEAYNFGQSTVYYKLFAHFEMEVTKEDWLQIEDEIGALPPMKATKIQLKYRPHSRGEHKFEIMYRLRQSPKAKNVVAKYKKRLFTFSCQSVYPYVEVVDITEHNFGRLFSNPNLWTLLNLADLNNLLKAMKSGDTKTFSVNLPDNEFCKKDFYMTLALRNPTPFPITIRMSRLKVCECRLVEVSKSLSLRKQQYQCLHRNVFAVSPKELTVEAGSINYINFHIQYNLIGKTTLCYRLTFPQNRELTMEFVVRTLSNNDRVISKYTENFYMALPSVWYGERDPSFHIFWFYNVSSVAVGYTLDISKLKQINDHYDFDIFKCLNPVGMVMSFGTVPLMFKFTPIDDKKLCVTLPLRVGNEFTYFQLSCAGSKNFNRFRVSQHEKPAVKTGSYLVPSEDYITLNPMPLYSVTNRIFFLRNTSSKTSVAYTCKRYKLPGVIDATIVLPKGIIAPKGSHAIIVQVRSYGRACRIQVQITIKYLEISKFLEHKNCLTLYQQRQKEIEGQFVITEKGVEYPKNEIKIPSFPEFSYDTITLDVPITSLRDRDLYHSTAEQLKHSPHRRLRLDDRTITRDSRRRSADSEEGEPIIMIGTMRCSTKQFSLIAMSDINVIEWTDYDLYHDLLEYLLSDIVFSKLFRHILYKIHEEPPLYYSQIRTTDERERKNLLSDLYLVPQAPLVTEILKETIADSIFHMYKLGTTRKHHTMSSDYEDEEKLKRYEMKYRSILNIL